MSDAPRFDPFEHVDLSGYMRQTDAAIAAAAAQAREALRQRPVRPSYDHPLGAAQQGLHDGMVDAIKREQQEALRRYADDLLRRAKAQRPFTYATWTSPSYAAHSDANRHTQPLHHTLPDREGVYNITTLED